MACVNPNIMAVIDLHGYNPLNARYLKEHDWKLNFDTMRGYRLLSRGSRDLPLENIESWRRLKDMEIPCCSCVQCRLDYSKNWAVRCYCESLQYKHNYFVTLTYDDEHLIKGKLGNPTLVKDDEQKFMKRLRFKLSELGHVGVRFFGCGEYGDQSFRPHMHFILFNCPLPDLTPHFIDENGQITHHVSATGDVYYYSQLIKDCWPHGFIMVADANYNTEAYVSRYIMKKQKGKDGSKFYEQLGITAPFLVMSNRPGIGQKFLDENQLSLIENPSIIVPRANKVPMISGVPRYYKKKIHENTKDCYGRSSVYENMMTKAKDNILKSRSLVHDTNRNREAVQTHIEKSFDAYGRNKL